MPEEGVIGVTAALVTNFLADGFGEGGEIAEDLLDGLGFEAGGFGDGLVEFTDVGGVMFVVVNLHGFGIDPRFEGIVVVAEGGEFKDWGNFRGRFGGEAMGGEGEGAGGEGEIFKSGATGDHKG